MYHNYCNRFRVYILSRDIFRLYELQLDLKEMQLPEIFFFVQSQCNSDTIITDSYMIRLNGDWFKRPISCLTNECLIISIIFPSVLSYFNGQK